MENPKIAACPKTSNTNPVKAIRMLCLSCSGGSAKEVDLCPVKDCAVFPFRYGKNPFRTRRELTEDEKQRLREQLEKGRKARSEKNS